MNQNFGFLAELEGPLMTRQKKLTNRPLSPHRLKCKVGDRMHCFVGMRTPNARKLFDAIVIERHLWSIDDAPKTEPEAAFMNIIDVQYKKEITIWNKSRKWKEFALMDGFETYEQFYNYFSNHPKKKKVFLMFVFEPIIFNILFQQITEFIEV